MKDIKKWVGRLIFRLLPVFSLLHNYNWHWPYRINADNHCMRIILNACIPRYCNSQNIHLQTFHIRYFHVAKFLSNFIRMKTVSKTKNFARAQTRANLEPTQGVWFKQIFEVIFVVDLEETNFFLTLKKANYSV